MAKISKTDMPAYVRRCYDLWKKATARQREAEVERLKFYAGGDLQWRETELEKRRNQQRPWVTINRCKPAVDQVEGDIRLNAPGPAVEPVGSGADKETADIIAGLIREVEYRSPGKVAYVTAGKYVAASGYGVLELATEYESENSFAQRLVIQSVEDPSTVFFDPYARKANRQDASWAGKLKSYSQSEYVAAFGNKRRVLEPRSVQQAMGWIQQAMGYEGDRASVTEWTGGGKGPYYVAEFYVVESEPGTQRMYEDNIIRWDDDEIPAGVKPKEGEEYSRQMPRRTVHKYVVDALETLDDTEWYGTMPPLFPVLGPEVYIDGKLHRLSLISGALDSNRALNYVATTATELAGILPKSPWLGPKGTFDDPRWLTANSEMWAYMEYTPVFVTDETTGAQQLAPAPQRNMWEAPIQWLLALAQYFSDAIKAVTAIYDPSLGQRSGDQSGKAIEQLRSESSVGTYSYADNLHRAIEVMYGQMLIIFPKLMDGPRAVSIVRPDSQHEVALINQIFPTGVSPKTGKKHGGYHIAMGQYAVRVAAGPSFQTRQDNAVQVLLQFFAKVPQALGIPGVAAQFLRLVGQGNPQVEHMADLMSPGGQGEEGDNPQQMQAQMQQLQQQNQALTTLVQKLEQTLSSKMPEIEAKKWIAALNAIAGIREAEIRAGVDLSAGEMQLLDSILAMSHERAAAQIPDAGAAQAQAGAAAPDGQGTPGAQ